MNKAEEEAEAEAEALLLVYKSSICPEFIMGPLPSLLFMTDAVPPDNLTILHLYLSVLPDFNIYMIAPNDITTHSSSFTFSHRLLENEKISMQYYHLHFYTFVIYNL